jgi:hypothetical protein
MSMGLDLAKIAESNNPNVLSCIQEVVVNEKASHGRDDVDFCRIW